MRPMVNNLCSKLWVLSKRRGPKRSQKYKLLEVTLIYRQISHLRLSVNNLMGLLTPQLKSTLSLLSVAKSFKAKHMI